MEGAGSVEYNTEAATTEEKKNVWIPHHQLGNNPHVFSLVNFVICKFSKSFFWFIIKVFLFLMILTRLLPRAASFYFVSTRGCEKAYSLPITICF